MFLIIYYLYFFILLLIKIKFFIFNFECGFMIFVVILFNGIKINVCLFIFGCGIDSFGKFIIFFLYNKIFIFKVLGFYCFFLIWCKYFFVFK